jgi:hypothetical protein
MPQFRILCIAAFVDTVVNFYIGYPEISEPEMKEPDKS